MHNMGRKFWDGTVIQGEGGDRWNGQREEQEKEEREGRNGKVQFKNVGRLVIEETTRWKECSEEEMGGHVTWGGYVEGRVDRGMKKARWAEEKSST